MRLVRRVFAGAAASLALGALFTGMALGAEPTADADVSVDLGLGLGTDGDPGVDAALDELLGGTDDVAAATNGVTSVEVGTDPAAGSTVDVTIGAATAPDVTGEATVVADADAQIGLDASETTFAVAGRRGGSVFNVDLGAASDGSTGTIENVAAHLAIGAEADDPAADAVGTASVVLGAGTDASDASGSVAADLAIGAGTDASDASASLGIGAALNAVPTALGIVDGAVAVLGLGTVTDATDPVDGVGTGAVTDVVATAPDVVRGSVLGIQTTAATLLTGAAAGGDAPAGGDSPTGRGGMAGPVGPGGTSLPDTAFGVGSDVALWGLLLVLAAGLMASGRRLPSRRRR